MSRIEDGGAVEAGLVGRLANGGHTPGPWNRNIKPARKYTAIWAGRNTHVAYIAAGGEAISDDELEANIDLIAAAPSLLDIAIQQAAEITRLRAENAGMREALEPFAAVAEHDIGETETDLDLFRPMSANNHAPKLTVGDLRRARAALSNSSQAEGQTP